MGDDPTLTKAETADSAAGSDGAVAAPGPSATQASDLGPRLASIAGKYGLLITFLLTIVVFCLLRPSTFATTENAEAILTLAAPPMIMAVGLTVVLVMQDFDLSFGR